LIAARAWANTLAMDQRTHLAAERSSTAPRGLLERSAAHPFAWLMGSLGLLLLVRLAALALNRTDLYYDEAQYWAWAQAPAFGYYSKPPLIAWLIAASTSVCGNTEPCVRLASPLLHTLSALAIFVLASRLYDRTTGVLAALAFALIPGVSFSSGIISTDVPLLLAWALALIGFVALFDTRAWWPALVLGAALGLGLNAKYAMAWFVPCAGFYLALTPARRGILRDSRLWAAVAICVTLILPNLAWNQAHAFATFSHTADNAKWSGGLVHPLKAAEFLLSQFGVFGPFYFAGLLVIAYRSSTSMLPEADRLLLAFSLPLIAIITVQAFVSRAHANWAAMAYVPGVAVVIATLVRERAAGWLHASYLLHGAALAVMIAATSTAGLAKLPGLNDLAARTLGWHGLGDVVSAEAERARRAGHPYAAILTDKRAVAAELIYYMRAEGTPVLAYTAGGRPHDHFELSRPYTQRSGEPVLLVELGGATGPESADATPPARQAFAVSEPQGGADIAAGSAKPRRVTFVKLSGYKGP